MVIDVLVVSDILRLLVSGFSGFSLCGPATSLHLHALGFELPPSGFFNTNSLPWPTQVPWIVFASLVSFKFLSWKVKMFWFRFEIYSLYCVASDSGRAPGYRLSPDHFQTVKRILAPDWAQKMHCIIVPNRRTDFREFVHNGYYLATVARFIHQAFLTRQRNYRWLEKCFGCYQREHFNL